MPLIWFPLLREATPEQRAHYEIGGGGLSLRWPEAARREAEGDMSQPSSVMGLSWEEVFEERYEIE